MNKFLSECGRGLNKHLNWVIVSTVNLIDTTVTVSKREFHIYLVYTPFEISWYHSVCPIPWAQYLPHNGACGHIIKGVVPLDNGEPIFEYLVTVSISWVEVNSETRPAWHIVPPNGTVFFLRVGMMRVPVVNVIRRHLGLVCNSHEDKVPNIHIFQMLGIPLNYLVKPEWHLEPIFFASVLHDPHPDPVKKLSIYQRWARLINALHSAGRSHAKAAVE